MAFTYSPGSGPRDTVRLLITDTDAANPIFQDADIDAFLSLQGGDVKLAAAQSLDTIASSEALVSKAIKLGDLTTNGPAVAKALREHAAELRRQSEVEAGFDVAEVVYDAFSFRQRVRNEWLRGDL